MQRPVAPDTRPPPPLPKSAAYEYRYMTEFQSHEPEFDYLKSLEIEEKINKVTWCRSSNSSRMLLSTNDKTIKLWRVSDKKVTALTGFNVPGSHGGAHGGPAATAGGPWGNGAAAAAAQQAALQQPPVFSRPQHLRIPRAASSETMLSAKCRRVFANAHTYHINSISVNTDQQTFLSADDLRINLWDFEVADQSFNIVDIKPSNMEDLTEVITCAIFHPQHCNVIAYSTSKGVVRLADMRSAALCDKHAKAFEEPEAQVGD